MLSKERILILGLAVVALAPRLAFLGEWYRPGPWNLPVIDALEYETEAIRILEGRPTPGVYWHAPLYPYFIAGVYALGDWSPRRVALVQAVLGAAACLLLYGLARRWLSPGRAGAAAIICSVYGPLLYFEGQLLRTGLFLPALFLWFLIHLEAARSRRGWGWFASGALLGICALIMETALVLAPAALVWSLVRSRGQGAGGRPWIRTALFAAGVLAALAPVALRNWSAGKEAVLISSSGGINFYIGNHPDTEAIQRIRPGRDWEELTARPRRFGAALTPGERSDYFYKEGARFWLEDGSRALRITARKTLGLLSSHEIPRNQDLYEGRAHSLVLSALAWTRGPFGFPFGIVGPLAFLGVAVSLRRRDELGLAALLVLVYAAGIIAFFPAARYRIPLVPFLALFAVVGYGRLAEDFDRRRPWLAVSILGIGFAAVNLGGVRARHEPAESAFMTAWTLTQKGQPVAAIWKLEEALRLDPRHAEAATNLSALYGIRGEPGRAAALARQALSADSTYAKAWVNLGLADLDLRRGGEAVRSMRRALDLQPDLADAWGPYLRILREEGRLESALPAAAEATSRWPRDPTGWLRRGEIHLELGRSEEAEGFFREALSRNGRYAEAWYALGLALSRQGRDGEAEAAWKAALRIESRHAGARDMLSRAAPAS